MVAIQIRVLPDEAARILAAIDVHAAEGNRADGVVALAEAGLAATAAVGVADAEVRVRSPVEVVMHVSAETLTGVTDLGDGLPVESDSPSV